jgi:hypothetical protein
MNHLFDDGFRPLYPDGELMLCPDLGVAFEAGLTVTVRYDQAYFDKCAAKEGTAIADKINAGRVALVARHHGDRPLIDVGVGTGEFIRKRGGDTFGYDVNRVAEAWLKDSQQWAPPDRFPMCPAFSFWDVIEHLPDPDVYFRHIAPGAYVFACLPILEDLRRIRESRHYRPGEHLWYFTKDGFVGWMAAKGFRCREVNSRETEAGRDSVLAFAFRREG